MDTTTTTEEHTMTTTTAPHARPDCYPAHCEAGAPCPRHITAQEHADQIATRYGVQTEGEAVGHQYHQGVSYANQMTLAEVFNARGRITRVRLLQERGRVDISYIHATLLDGTVVPVNLNGLPSGSMGIPRRAIKGDFIAWGKAEGVFAKGLGLLDEGNWSVLH